MTKFDPWDWLGVDTGGFNKQLDLDILTLLECLNDGIECNAVENGISSGFVDLACTLLCNTDAFEFDDTPTQLRWVGDDRFDTLDQLIDAWDKWYGNHYK